MRPEARKRLTIDNKLSGMANEYCQSPTSIVFEMAWIVNPIKQKYKNKCFLINSGNLVWFLTIVIDANAIANNIPNPKKLNPFPKSIFIGTVGKK